MSLWADPETGLAHDSAGQAPLFSPKAAAAEHLNSSGQGWIRTSTLGFLDLPSFSIMLSDTGVSEKCPFFHAGAFGNIAEPNLWCFVVHSRRPSPA